MAGDLGMRRCVLLAACLAACASRDSRPESVVIDTLPGGIPRVTSAAPTAWGDTNGWKLVGLDSISPAAGSPGELVNPASMAVDGWGRVYVADQSPAVIKLYDSMGAFVRTIGREGEGPAEYRTAFIAVRGNRLMVHDPQLQRTSLFDTSGAFIRSFTSVGSVWADRVTLDAAQRAVLPVLDLDPVDSRPDPAEMYVRFDTLGVVLDTIRVPQVTAEHVWRIIRDGRVRSEIPIPFAPATRATFGSDSGVIYGATSDYAIAMSSGHGDTSRVVRRGWTPSQIPDTLRDQVFEGLITALKGHHDEAVLRRTLRKSDIPLAIPAWAGLIADDRGNLWVWRQSGSEGGAFDVFDASGVWLGVVGLPPGMRGAVGMVVRRGKVYLATMNAEGYPVIRRWLVQERPVGQAGRSEHDGR
jgi:hypothetical protein